MSLPQALNCWASMPIKILQKHSVYPHDIQILDKIPIGKTRKGRRSHSHKRRNRNNSSLYGDANIDTNNHRKKRRNRRRHSRKRGEHRHRYNTSNRERAILVQNSQLLQNGSALHNITNSSQDSLTFLNVHSSRNRHRAVSSMSTSSSSSISSSSSSSSSSSASSSSSIMSNNLRDHLNHTDREMMADSPHNGFHVSAEPHITYLVESNMILASPEAHALRGSKDTLKRKPNNSPGKGEKRRRRRKYKNKNKRRSKKDKKRRRKDKSKRKRLKSHRKQRKGKFFIVILILIFNT